MTTLVQKQNHIYKGEKIDRTFPGEFIKFLMINEVESAACKDIAEVEAFVFLLFVFLFVVCALLCHSMKAEHERKPEEEDESEIQKLKKELGVSVAKIDSLEKENQELKQEVSRLKGQISSLRAHNNERKTMLWKKFQLSMDSSYTDASPGVTRADIPESTMEKPMKVPNPPPKPSSVAPSLPKEVKGNKAPPAPAPPPPPPPSKSLVGTRAVRRVPEVMELYRSLTRRDAHKENRSNSAGTPVVAFTKNMIGEIENRSTYRLAIKSDVERRGEFIKFLIKEVESAAYKDIAEVEAFVKWLDGELSSLVDERAVLKHFPQWPERKADALREASFSYRDLKSLESEVSSFKDNPKEPLTQALRRIQALQDRLEQSIDNVERMRESTSKRYRDLQIPWEWMLDTGLVGKMKLSSLRLAKEYMKRITKELQSDECSCEENLMLQGVRYAYRVHQFAGGFDAETIQAFEKLKKVGLGTDN